MRRKAMVVAAGLVTALAGIHLVMVPSLAGRAEASEAEETISGRFLLETTDGARVTDAAFAGRYRLMTFGYTFCPDVCPTTLSTLMTALDKLEPEQAARFVPIFVSVDPERDTRAHLKDYVAAFGPTLVGLTGSPAMVAAAARQFRVRYDKQPAADGDPDAYLIDHTAGIYIMDPDGSFVARVGHNVPPDKLAERLKRVLNP